MIDLKPAFGVFSEVVVLITFEESKISLAKILHIDIILAGKPFIYIKKQSASNTHPCDTPECIFIPYEVCPLAQLFVFSL